MGKKNSDTKSPRKTKAKLVRRWTNITPEQDKRLARLAKKKGLHTEAAALSYCLNDVCDREGIR